MSISRLRYFFFIQAAQDDHSQNPVKTDHKEVLATVYVNPGRTLISLASWATNSVNVRLKIDSAALGLNPATFKLQAPLIQGFQAEAQFKAEEVIPVVPGKGWLLRASDASKE